MVTRKKKVDDGGLTAQERMLTISLIAVCNQAITDGVDSVTIVKSLMIGSVNVGLKAGATPLDLEQAFAESLDLGLKQSRSVSHGD